MTVLDSERISLREYHVMLAGYHEQLLDRYDLAGFQALLNRNAQSKKVRKVSDLFKRPETAKVARSKAEEREQLAKKLERNKSIFNDIEAALRTNSVWKKGR